MKRAEILTKAIEKALNNRWAFPHQSEDVEIVKWCVIDPINSGEVYLSVFYKRKNNRYFDADSQWEIKYSENDIVFRHDFACAFFGKQKISIGDYEGETFLNGGGSFKEIFKPEWKYRLQEMVVERNAVEYLGYFLDE